MRVNAIFALLAVSVLMYAQSQRPSPTPLKSNEADQNKATPKQSKEKSDNTIANPPLTSIDQQVSPRAARNQEKSGTQHKDESPTDWWGRASTILITAFTGALAWLAHRQHQAMKRQAEYMRDGLELTKQSADAATLAAKVAENAFRAANRPYVGVQSADRTHVGYAADNSPLIAPAGCRFPDSTEMTFGVEVKNFGMIPASTCRIRWRMLIDEHEPQGFMIKVPDSPTILFPGHSLFTKAKIMGDLYPLVMSGEKVMCVLIHIGYEWPGNREDLSVRYQYDPRADCFLNLGLRPADQGMEWD